MTTEQKGIEVFTREKNKRLSNFVNVEGVVSSYKLEDKTFDSGFTRMDGYIRIKVAENSEVSLTIQQAKFKKDSTELNEMYKGLETIKNKIVSIADRVEAHENLIKQGYTEEQIELAQDAVNNAEALDAQGITLEQALEMQLPEPTGLKSRIASLENNEYYGGPLDELISYQRAVGVGFTEIALDKLKPEAVFLIEGVVTGKRLETNEEGETGRAILTVAYPTYKHELKPFELIVHEDGTDYIMENYDIGDTVSVNGDIKNVTKVTEKVIQMGFGQDRVERSYESKTEYIVTAGSEAYDDENPKKLSPEQIELGQKNRLATLEKNKAASEAKKNAKPKAKSAFATTAPTKSGFGTSNTKVDDVEKQVNDMFSKNSSSGASGGAKSLF